MKRILLSVCLIIAGSCFAEDMQTQSMPANSRPNPAVINQNIPYENCTKMFTVGKEKLFYLTLCAINANRFKTEEIQTSNGYIIFTAAKHKYIATIAGIDKDNSILKITPCNNMYFFQPGIIDNIFKYIELNKNTEIK